MTSVIIIHEVINNMFFYNFKEKINMKFGSVENPENIDFTLPKDHADTIKVLNKVKEDNIPEVYVGCAKWNKADLKAFLSKRY